MPARWSLPLAVGDWTWDNPGGPKSTRLPIFGAIQDPAETVDPAVWYKRASYDAAVFGDPSGLHGAQFGPTPLGPTLRHVASGNEYYVASMVAPHYPDMMPKADADTDGFFETVCASINQGDSLVTQMAAGVTGSYFGYFDWHRNLVPLFGTTLELLTDAGI